MNYPLNNLNTEVGRENGNNAADLLPALKNEAFGIVSLLKPA
ncbi:MAG: hypothetical protein QXN79_06030 [Zestosphaera sp.]